MNWAEVSIVFFVSHLVGDYLLQTDWQARHKLGGLGGDPLARRALFTHVSTYTVAFVPALIWIGGETGFVAAIGLALVIALPHLVIDDGRLLNKYIRKVKGCPEPVPGELARAVDQSFHLILLWATAMLAVALA